MNTNEEKYRANIQKKATQHLNIDVLSEVIIEVIIRYATIVTFHKGHNIKQVVNQK